MKILVRMVKGDFMSYGPTLMKEGTTWTLYDFEAGDFLARGTAVRASSDERIQRLAIEIREKIKDGTVYGIPYDNSDDWLLVAAYAEGTLAGAKM